MLIEQYGTRGTQLAIEWKLRFSFSFFFFNQLEMNICGKIECLYPCWNVLTKFILDDNTPNSEINGKHSLYVCYICHDINRKSYNLISEGRLNFTNEQYKI